MGTLRRSFMLLATFVIVISFIGIAFSGLSYGASSQRANIASVSNNGVLRVEYKIVQGKREFFETSLVYMINQSTVQILSNLSSHINSEKKVFSSYVIPLTDTEFILPSGNWHYFKSPGGNSTWKIKQKASHDGSGLVYSSLLIAINKAMGVNYHSMINLVSKSGDLLVALQNIRIAGKYYFFIPEIIPTVPGSQYSEASPSLVHGPPGGGGGIGGTAYLSERDNTVADIHIWHIGTTLSVSSFTSGSSGWSSSLNAAAGTNNPFHNWWLESKSIKTSENSQHTEVTTDSGAYFFGIFPLGPYDFWYAYPNVQVNIFPNGTMTAVIHDVILVSGSYIPLPVPWSDSTIFNGQFYGYQYSVQYIV